MSIQPTQVKSDTWWEILPDACCVLDGDGRVVVANTLFIEMVGRTHQQLTGLEFAQLLHPEDRAALHHHLSDIGAETSSVRARLGVGNERHLAVDWSCRALEGGTVLLARPYRESQTGARSPAGLEQIENDLELQRQWLRHSEMMAGIGHWHLSLEDSILYWSDQIYRIHGLDPQTHIPKLESALDAYHPDDRAKVAEAVQLCKETGESFEFRSRLIRSDGSERIVLSRGERWDGPDGKPAALFGVFMDLTDSLDLSQKLEMSESRYQALFVRTPALLYSVDAQGQFIEVSDLWLDGMGYERAEVLGRRVYDFLSPDTQALVADIKNKYLRTGACADVPITFLRRDGRPFDVLLSTVSENDSSGRVLRSHVACQDLTGQLRAERALDESHSMVLRKNRELKEIAVAASHDLKAPVRNIVMFTALLRERCNEESLEFLGYICEAGIRLQTIVTDLSRYMALEEDVLSFREVDLNEVVEQVLRGLHSVVLESEAEVEVAELPTVVGAAKQLYSLFENIFSNALKFRGSESPKLKLECEEAATHWTFTLRDNGIGIPEKFRDDVFKLFRRLHSVDRYEGSGAGLALAKKVVDYHGGEIRFLPSESGARLQFSLRKMVLSQG